MKLLLAMCLWNSTFVCPKPSNQRICGPIAQDRFQFTVRPFWTPSVCKRCAAIIYSCFKNCLHCQCINKNKHKTLHDYLITSKSLRPQHSSNVCSRHLCQLLGFFSSESPFDFYLCGYFCASFYIYESSACTSSLFYIQAFMAVGCNVSAESVVKKIEGNCID